MIVAGLMAALFLSSSWQILRQGLREFRTIRHCGQTTSNTATRAMYESHGAKELPTLAAVMTMAQMAPTAVPIE